MSDILRVFLHIFTLRFNVVAAQDVAFSLLDDSVPSQTVSDDILRLASSRVVFLSVPVLPVCVTREIFTCKVSLYITE